MSAPLFSTVRTEGNLLPAELLPRITGLDKVLGGLTPEDYHLVGTRLNEAISQSWTKMLTLWANFRAARGQLPAEAGTGLTRDKLLLPLFQELGYGRLQGAKATEVEGCSYPISHLWEGVPIHLVGFGIELDRRTAGAAGAARQSPHSLVQEYLNRTEALWGFVSNGLALRLLRDNASLSRQAYLEFDLESMFEGEAYADFALLWLVAHQSRVESRQPQCWLEEWAKAGQEQGKRALEHLREGVQWAIETLGQGFLAHPANADLRKGLRSGSLDKQDYYRQLLRLVYRLMVLFVAEEREALLDPEASEEAREAYRRYYSLARLRAMAGSYRGTRHADLYEGLKVVFRRLGEGGAPELALKPLGSFLFAPEALGGLANASLANRDLLDALRALAYTGERDLRAVDYKNLGSEELGSVYESLLELTPEVNIEAARFGLRSVAGNERKTSGSYYTPTSLIEVVLDEALESRLDEAVKSPDPERTLLSLKVVDPAAGSGHFLIAAAHRIARRLAQTRTGEAEPPPQAHRQAVREVITHCLYAVDLNPMAVELCKVALWMESLEPGKPLGFLDAHVKLGNALLGAPRDFYRLGIPSEAHKREDVPEDVRRRAKTLGAKALAKWRGSEQPDLFEISLAGPDLGDADDLDGVQAQERRYREWRESEAVKKYEFMADYWTAAWLARPAPGDSLPDMDGLEALAQSLEQADLDSLKRRAGSAARLTGEAKARFRPFHWWLEFPEVFFGPQSGFDVVLGNPPWERVKLTEKEFFAGKNQVIAEAENAAKRKRLIERLREEDPALHADFEVALASAEATSSFLRTSGRYPLAGVGDVNTYQVFAEHNRHLISHIGRCGMIIPTGIATSDGLKDFFQYLVDTQSLSSILSFSEVRQYFPATDSRDPFCITVLTGTERPELDASFVFSAKSVEELAEAERRFTLTRDELALLNPNTKTCPVFRSRTDADLTKKIYRRVPVLMREAEAIEVKAEGALLSPEAPLFEGERASNNPWGIRFMTMFHMSSDSGLFRTREQLESEGWRLEGNRFERDGETYLPLYEAKMAHHFDHRFATYDGEDTRDTTADEHARPDALPLPRYWVPESEVEERLVQRDRNRKAVWEWRKSWVIAFRAIGRSTDERTFIGTLMPISGLGNSTIVATADEANGLGACILLGSVCSMILDFIARQKVGGTNMNMFYVKQFPVLPPSTYKPRDLLFIVPRVLELTYTAWDLAPFAQDVWDEADETLREAILAQHRANGGHPDTPPAWAAYEYPFPPFRWDEGRRALLRADLDACYARLYGLSREELQYILDPQSVKGPDFPGETFRVLKDKELRAYGEYRTMRLVLEAWDRLERPGQAPSFPVPAAPPRPDHRSAALAYAARHFGERGIGGSTRLQKYLYLYQTHARLPLGLKFVRWQFGPFDKAIYELVEQAERDGWLAHSKGLGGLDKYQTLPGATALLQEAEALIKPASAEIEKIHQALDGGDTDFVEAICTLYAVWNDALLEGRSPTDREIADEAKNGWHHKKELPHVRILEGFLNWMRQVGLVPTGQGASTKAATGPV